LRERGWLVPAYSMPPNREDLVIQRILVRHGFTREMADQLLVEMRNALDHFAQHSPETPSTLELVGAGPISHDHSGR
jgi:glutamate decarboxylase